MAYLGTALTLDGCKKLHQFLDVGKKDSILVRHRPCHFCDGCMKLQKGWILNKCPHNGRCGKAKVVQLKAAKSRVIEDGADWYVQRGQRLTQEAEVGDYLAFEVACPAIAL